MATAEEQLSPEEKLLKVIQGGTPQKPAPAPGKAAEPAVATAPPAPSAPAAAGAEKAAPALKLAKDRDVAPGKGKARSPEEATASAGPAAAKPASAGEEGGVKPPAESAAVAGKERIPRDSGIRAVNRFLLAAVFLALALAAFEIWANVRTAEQTPGDQAQPDASPSPQAAGALLPALAPIGPEASGVSSFENVLREFAERPIVTTPELENAVASGPGAEGPKQSDLQVYARDNLKLKGLSVIRGARGDETEAILEDRKQNRLLFVRAGQKVKVSDRELQVEQVAGDQVVLSDGQNRVAVK